MCRISQKASPVQSFEKKVCWRRGSCPAVKEDGEGGKTWNEVHRRRGSIVENLRGTRVGERGIPLRCGCVEFFASIRRGTRNSLWMEIKLGVRILRSCKAVFDD